MLDFISTYQSSKLSSSARDRMFFIVKDSESLAHSKYLALNSCCAKNFSSLKASILGLLKVDVSDVGAMVQNATG